MSTFNKVFIQGVISSEPDYQIDPVLGKVVYLPIKILREDIGREETITLVCRDADKIVNLVNDVHAGDIFMTNNARLISVNYEKRNDVICPDCGEEYTNRIAAERTEIEFYDYQILPKGAKLAFNRVFTMGSICSDIISRPLPNGKFYVKYKLAVGRYGKARTEQAYDFPFIVSFGREAENAVEHLEKGRTVLIEGSIQERQITQKVACNCPKCAAPSTTNRNSIVRELITSNVTYVKAPLVEETEEEMRAEVVEKTEE